MFATATAMTVLRQAANYYLFPPGTLAFTLATASRDCRRRPRASL